MFFLDGQELQIDTPFEHDGIKYPANWLRLSTPEERAAIGITEVTPEPRPNDEFYYVSDNGDGTYTAIPRPVPEVQSYLVASCNDQSYRLLFPTDWMIIRRSETGVEVPADILTYRGAVRTSCENNVASVQACTTIPELEALVFTWPEPPAA